MGPDAWPLFFLCAFVAEVIGSMAGFGAATILTPVAALFLDIKTAIAVVTCFHLFGNVSRLVFFGRFIHWRTWALFGLTGVVCSLVGAAMTARVPSPAVELGLGVFLLLYVGGSSWWPARWLLPGTSWTLLGGGVASGFIAGLLGTGGAIRAACLMAFDLSRDAYLGTSAALAVLVDGARLPVYLMEGFIPLQMGVGMAGLMGVAFAGVWMGRRLVQRISAVAFRRFVLIMLALMSIKLSWDGWHGLAALH